MQKKKNLREAVQEKISPKALRVDEENIENFIRDTSPPTIQPDSNPPKKITA